MVATFDLQVSNDAITWTSLKTQNNASNVTLTATGSHVVNTTAEGGGQSTGATGVGGALALTVADNQTEARIGTAGSSPLDVTGEIKVTATHHGSSTTTAKGDGTGSSTAVGVALALGFVDDSGVATTDRNLTAGKAVSFTASADGASKSHAIASAKGADKSVEEAKQGSKSGEGTADKQAQSAIGTSNKQSGENKSVDNKGSASTESGSVSVGASLALNVANNKAIASVGDGRTINAGGAGVGSLTVSSASRMSAEAIAEGVAGTTPSGDAIGVGVAINVAFETNEASIGEGANVTADGATIEATMIDEEIDLTPTTIPIVNTTDNTIFVGANYGGLKTGDKVYYDNGGGTSIGGLDSSILTNYSVVTQEGGKIKLRAVDSSGNVGAFVDLTSTGSGTQHKLKHAIDTGSVSSALGSLLKQDVTFDPATNRRLVNLSEGHGLRTGDAITYESGSGAMSGLDDGQTYYIILLDDNTAELAASAQDANAGKAITLATAGGANQKLIDRTSTFRAEAVSGASGGDTGIAGSIAVNFAKTNTQATIGLDHAPIGSSTTTLTLDGADVDIRAQSLTETTVTAKPAGIAKGADTGVGASVAINISLNTTFAGIENGVTVNGTAEDFLVSADSANNAYTYAAAGAAGSGTAVGGAIALAYIENDTTARIGSGAGGPITLNGDLGATATHRDTVVTLATGEAAGNGTGVGIALALNIIQDDTKAELSRSFNGAQDVNVGSTSLILTTAEARASAAGASSETNKDENNDGKKDKARDSDQETDAQSKFVGDRSGSSNKTAPSQDSGSSLGKANENTEKQSSNSSDSNGGTSVAASVGVNYLEADNRATIAGGVIIVVSGLYLIFQESRGFSKQFE